VFREDDAWSGQPHEADRYAGWAKRIGELQIEAYKREYDWCPIAIVRPANVYGPGDNFDPKTAMVIPALIARVAAGERPLTVWGNGKVVRDFIYADDVARGMLLAMALAADGTPINLGSGEGISIGRVAEAIVAQGDDPPEIVWDTSKPSGEDARVLDTRRAQERLGFSCLYSFEEGIERTVRWYRAGHRHAAGRYNVFSEEART
jgi:GDP-L-fucose synthase